jgi:pimeloyl-ACP methyl ester carboxylesterase
MRLHAVEQGRGPPVCLLHGLFGRSQNLASVARALATRCRVLSLDLRNHGASPHAAGMAYAALAEDVRETLAHHAALPAGLLGHSMGGKVAMTLALAAACWWPTSPRSPTRTAMRASPARCRGWR